MKRFRKLPTDPVYQNLTTPQRKLLWEDFKLEHPEVLKKLDEAEDEGFNEDWEQIERGEQVSLDKLDEAAIADNFQKFLQEHDWEEVE